jgi:Dyp-type peroxidase family
MTMPVRELARRDEPTLEMTNIQGNVVAGFNKDFQTLLFFRIDDADRFKPAIAKLGRSVATAEKVLDFNRRYREDNTLKATWMNLAISSAGLRKLRNDVDRFADAAFGSGMVMRSRLLGDRQEPGAPGNPEKWKVRDDTAHLMVIVAADKLEDQGNGAERVRGLIHEVEEVRALIRVQGGATEVWADEGRVIRALEGKPRGALEHFGYRDGVSQPGIRGRASANSADLLTPRENPDNPDHGRPGQELVWPGEFVFGYPDQDGRLEGGEPDWMTGGDGFRLAPDWAKNGSYLVYRRLRQYVHRFHESVQDDLDGARIVGRWFTGTPIVNAPTANSLATADANANANDFSFVEGEVEACPGNAHIRKVNPRGEFDLRERSKHRLLRRGITFGPRSASTPERPVDDGVERGLLFLAYMTSIKYQFEFVMKFWANHRDFRAAGVGADALLSGDWIEPTGGGYFFAPSVSALTDVLSV